MVLHLLLVSQRIFRLFHSKVKGNSNNYFSHESVLLPLPQRFRVRMSSAVLTIAWMRQRVSASNVNRYTTVTKSVAMVTSWAGMAAPVASARSVHHSPVPSTVHMATSPTANTASSANVNVSQSRGSESQGSDWGYIGICWFCKVVYSLQAVMMYSSYSCCL